MSYAVLLFRLDLRLSDNEALCKAAASGLPVIPLFIVDPKRSWFPRTDSHSLWWLQQSLQSLKLKLKAKGADLIIRCGDTEAVLDRIRSETPINALYYHHCYHPGEDNLLDRWCQTRNVTAKAFTGALLVQPGEITTKSGTYFKVFTPFWNACLKQLDVPKPIGIPEHLLFTPLNSDPFPESTGPSQFWIPGEEQACRQMNSFASTRLENYEKQRDFPGIEGTSRLSAYLHFGEISIRTVFRQSPDDKFLSELGWREFSYHLLTHRPDLPNHPFDLRFSRFPWKKNTHFLQAWQEGRTGYPIVDAGMRQLNTTGWMHNRVRMIVASFLTKHLLQPWQEGAEWFMRKLVDADLANNSASWQWVAGCGADAAPYYRIFNPIVQGEKFDPQGVYVKQWVPEIAHVPLKFLHKPWEAEPLLFKPIVDHREAREKALEAFESLRTA